MTSSKPAVPTPQTNKPPHGRAHTSIHEVRCAKAGSNLVPVRCRGLCVLTPSPPYSSILD
eukprot:2838344-Prymnesium_polylepis.1